MSETGGNNGALPERVGSFVLHNRNTWKDIIQNAHSQVQVRLTLLPHLNCQTFAQLLAGSRDGF